MREAVAARTPVLVGCAQLVQRVPDVALAKEPLALMEEAARGAAEDAGAPGLLAQLDSIRVTQGLWEYANPAAWLGERFGAAQAETLLGLISGTTVQSMLSDAALAIQQGRRDVVLLAGGEAEHTKRRAQRSGAALAWTKLAGPKPDRVVGVPLSWEQNPDIRAGLRAPAQSFALFETALRFARGESVAAHRARLGALWERFARVAADNPNAWVRSAPSAEAIATPSDANPWVAYPYTKYLVANMVVDEAAALILCSAEAARRHGIPESRWVFPLAATEAVVARHLSERVAYDDEPPMRIAGQRALELAGVDAGALDFVDLYSCFPSAVQLGADALGLAPDRPLTLTGGLTFGGGPFNSYVLHAIATLMLRLREQPGARGLVSSVGGFFSKHAYGAYASRPPEQPFRFEDLAERVRALPRRELDADYVGTARIESYTIAHERGKPPRAVVALRTPDERRCWARSEDPELLARLREEEGCGREVCVAADRPLAV